MCGSQSNREWCYIEQIKGDTTYKTPYTPEIVARAQSMIERAAAINRRFTFCLTRPPGHHACESRIAGFCHENFAIKALDCFWLKHRKNCVILDIDAHYGDGTAAEIEQRPFGSFVSLHGFGAGVYPGTGASLKSDRILSLPLHPKATDAEYLQILEAEAIPFIVAKKPDILLVSAGFDGHVADTMAPLALTTQGYCEIGKRLASLHIPVFAVLEGGYNLATLGESVSAFVSAFITCESDQGTPVKQ
jgi:acetoin utilization deacetylase AcuC-like enzyme